MAATRPLSPWRPRSAPKYCEICSDVDGVYTADPRIVPPARRIGALSYEETQELAEAGAKVLNAQAVEFAKEQRIAIYARATASALPGADPSSDGTVVRQHAPRTPGAVAGVASERDLLVLQSSLDGDALLGMLDARGIAGKQLHTTAVGVGCDGLTVIVSRENLHDEGRLREELTRRFDQIAFLVDGYGAVSVVGAGINTSYVNVRRGSACLRERDITIAGIATSSFRITWLIARDRLDQAVRLLHAAFLEGNAPAVP